MRFGLLNKAFIVSALALAASCASIPPTLAQDSPGDLGALRLCADPDNLPFSSNDPANPGIYNEIGEAIGKALGRPVTHVWYRTYFGKRAVRVTMLAEQCDATIGLPASGDFMGPNVIFSKPLFNLGYGIVAPKGQSFSSVEDLKGKRVAVQFATEPQNIVGPRDDITAVTVLSPDEGMKALAEGRADAAFIWAPTAGYLNKTAYDGRFSIVEVDGPRLTWPAAIGYPKASASLRDSIDAALPEISKEFPALFAKYDLAPAAPSAGGAVAEKPAVVEKAAVTVAQAAPAPEPPKASTAEPAGAAPSGQPAGGAAEGSDVAPPMPPATPEMIAAGKEVFNGICAHCHGPDGVQGVKKIDLRRLTLRYHDGAYKMYWKTVHEGRPTKGMPTWKGVFNDEQFTQIFAFLSTIQSTE
ncbi:MAG TPA: transporter substrate-binding domain-containing protein [Roseiarcus sp.]|nr:transporter substrate-binding domain-containing protein [Roseiarcus sp.]